MKIKITQRAYNEVHGNNIHHFDVDQTPDVAEALAQRLIDEGKAEPVAKPAGKTHSDAQGKGK